uniref:SCP domain-containing protein n=1 Tax=Romanomermis culicivorax TaxID=13658 RepID=A0A915LAI2_ROMCU
MLIVQAITDFENKICILFLNETWDEDLEKFSFHSIQNGIDRDGNCPQHNNPNVCWYHSSTKWDRNLENFAIKTFAKFIDESSRCPGNDDLRGQGTCWFHNQTVDSVGFNVFQTSNWNFVKGSLFHWYHRHVGYVYGKYTIGQEKNADSYTQMVWARTKKIGCAIGTGGNVIDEYPYYNETTPKDWEKYKHHLVDECQIEHFKTKGFGFGGIQHMLKQEVIDFKLHGTSAQTPVLLMGESIASSKSSEPQAKFSPKESTVFS